MLDASLLLLFSVGALLLSLLLMSPAAEALDGESWRESSGREASDDCFLRPSSSDPLSPADAEEVALFSGVGSDSVRESIVSLLMILFTTCELL